MTKLNSKHKNTKLTIIFSFIFSFLKVLNITLLSFPLFFIPPRKDSQFIFFINHSHKKGRNLKYGILTLINNKHQNQSQQFYKLSKERILTYHQIFLLSNLLISLNNLSHKEILKPFYKSGTFLIYLIIPI